MQQKFILNTYILLLKCQFFLHHRENMVLFEQGSSCVTRWSTSLTCKRREVVYMSTYEVLTLLILFGTFLIALLACIDSRNNKRK